MKDKDTQLLWESYVSEDIQEPWMSWVDNLDVPYGRDHDEVDINYARIDKITNYLIEKADDIYHNDDILKTFANTIGPAALEAARVVGDAT